MDRIGSPRLSRRGTGPPAEAITGGFRVDAEADWLVEGDADGVRAVREAVPRGIAEAWGPVVRLRFGNAIGRIPAGPLGTLHVRSGKWTDADYEGMLGEIAAEATALPFAAGAASALPYARDPSEPEGDLPYHAFVWLRHALVEDPTRPLLGALRAIVADPHRRLVPQEREGPVQLASLISPRALDDVAAGRWPLQRAPGDRGVRGFLPLRISDAASRESVDTPENRFVKAFLLTCARTVADVRARLGSASGSIAAHVSASLDEVDAALVPIQRAALWSQVGRLTQMPTGSAVLQRRAPYREVLRSSVLLRAVSRVLPISEPEVVRLLEVKDIARLYELWCGFHLAGIVRRLAGAPEETAKIASDGFAKTIRYGLQARWLSGVELAMNPTYTRSMGFHGTSRSLDLRPDFALYVPVGPGAGLHLFDAKFRLAASDGGTSEARNEDLHKMHAYRDAIPGARSAWVLYPGDLVERYLDSKTGTAPLGVGAFPAVPGDPGDALLSHVAALLDLPVPLGRDRTSGNPPSMQSLPADPSAPSAKAGDLSDT